ncbi:MAG: DsbA family protein [Gemmatimonadota bacterium]
MTKPKIAEAVVNLALLVTVPTALYAVSQQWWGTDRDRPLIPEWVDNWKTYSSASSPGDSARSTLRIVSFSDFECPFCFEAYSALKDVEREAQDVTVSYRHFPLDFHRQARTAARIAVCAERQGRLDAALEVLFREARAGRTLNAEKVADEAQVRDFALLLTGVASDSTVSQRIVADSTAAAALGATGTPVILVDGWVYQGFPGKKALLDRVSDQRKARAAGRERLE